MHLWYKSKIQFRFLTRKTQKLNKINIHKFNIFLRLQSTRKHNITKHILINSNFKI